MHYSVVAVRLCMHEHRTRHFVMVYEEQQTYACVGVKPVGVCEKAATGRKRRLAVV